MDDRATRARRHPHDAPALLRSVQSGRRLPLAVRRSYRRRLQSAAGELGLIPGAGRDRSTPHPRHRTTRRLARGGGMVDPLASCAQIAREHGLWYHVDAAWGGAALCSERLRGLLAGIELADSLTIDAHKWFATTMGCGMFITRHPAVLSEAFRVRADFMPSNAQSLDPYLNTLQWSRRFMC